MSHLNTPFNIWKINDMTGSRQFDVTYTNSTGQTLFCTISFYHTITAAGGSAVVNAHADGISQHRSGVLAGVMNQIIYSTTVLIVKPGGNYGVNNIIAVNGTNNIYSWMEMY